MSPVSSAVLSALHVLALGLGLPSVFLRGRALRRVQTDVGALPAVFAADAVWGVSALVWLATGALRLFGPFEKGSAYYLHNHVFLGKMALFGLIFALELVPMVTLIRWRVRRAKQQPIDFQVTGTLTRLNDVELVLVLVLPFLASLMARGVGAG